MSDTNDIALSVKNLKTFFYTNNRCNKAVNGVSFDVKKGKTRIPLKLARVYDEDILTENEVKNR